MKIPSLDILDDVFEFLLGESDRWYEKGWIWALLIGVIVIIVYFGFINR